MAVLAAIAAPLAPVVILEVAGVTLLAILTFLILLGLRKTVVTWLHALVELLNHTTVLGIHLFRWLARAIDAGTQFIEEKIGNAAQYVSTPLANFLTHLAGIFEYAAFTTAYLAEDAYDAFQKLRHAVIPNLIHGLTFPVRALAHGTHSLAQWLVHRLARLESALARDFRLAERRAALAYGAAIAALAHAFGVALPRTLGWTEREIGRLSGELHSKLTRRLREIAAGVLAAVGAGIVVRALVRYLPWYRCSNVNKAARGLCGMDRGLLDALLLGTTIIAGSISLREFVRECQRFEPTVEDGLRYFVREFRDLGQ
jgi:hypothetical protein